MPTYVCAHAKCRKEIEVGAHVEVPSPYYCENHRPPAPPKPDDLAARVDAVQDEILENTVRGNEVFSPEMAEKVKPMLEEAPPPLSIQDEANMDQLAYEVWLEMEDVQTMQGKCDVLAKAFRDLVISERKGLS